MARASIVCFGEILWDCLPRGLFLGGAPFNVACHLARLGRSASLLSAVGMDFLGDEALRRARREGVDVRHVAQLPACPTGVVQVDVSPDGHATYHFPAPSAWDFIPVTSASLARVGESAAFVYGSLAARAPSGHAALGQLLAISGPLKIFDVNLRAPHDDPATALALARRADVVKLNADELARLAGGPFKALGDVRPMLEKLRKVTGVARWCVTLGAQGAAWWEGGEVIFASSPAITVRDTIGAGDAFLAALVDGLISQGCTAKSPARPGLQSILARACQLGALVASREGACPEYRPEEIVQASAV